MNDNIKLGWQDIRYAPLDGTKVDLLLNGVGRVPDCIFDRSEGFGEIDNTPMWVTVFEHAPVVFDEFNEITHFSHIPPLPNSH